MFQYQRLLSLPFRNNHLAMDSTLHTLFNGRGDRLTRPEVVVYLAETSPVDPLPTNYGMDGDMELPALVRAARSAATPAVDPSTAPAEHGHDQ